MRFFSEEIKKSTEIIGFFCRILGYGLDPFVRFNHLLAFQKPLAQYDLVVAKVPVYDVQELTVSSKAIVCLCVPLATSE
jgi:hypothetical protein